MAAVRLRRWLLAGLGLVVLWLAGLGWFALAGSAAPALPAHADGIVVLTGGAGRLELGLRLLQQGRADRLLVSGVGPAVTFADLVHLTGADPALAPRVTLGRAAHSTRGNATETAAWARRWAISSLLVVTSFYHMPRAMAEMRAALPGVTLYQVPVTPPGGVPLRLLVGEYTKFLAAELGLSRFGGHAGPGVEGGR